LTEQAAPQLVAVKGLGTQTAAALLVAAGDNPDRMRSESALRAPLRSRPHPRLIRQSPRHRLNRGGDRQANWALYILAVTRMAWDPATRAYVNRRTADGKTKKEIIRCLIGLHRPRDLPADPRQQPDPGSTNSLAKHRGIRPCSTNC
jgi:transposase